MGKSRRKSPWAPTSLHRSYNAEWQRRENRRYRRYAHRCVLLEREVLPYRPLWGSEWSSPRDGKFMWKWYSVIEGKWEVYERGRRK